MSDRTEIIVLLDRSGSMAPIAADMEGGYTAFVKSQEALPGDCRLTLVQFDSQGTDTVYESARLADARTMKLTARGGTPLLDALGDVIDRSGVRFAALPAAERPGKVFLVVITDGQENASTRFTKAQVKAKIDHQVSQYGWGVVYLGANVDAYAEAGAVGIAAGSTMNYVPDAIGTQSAFRGLSNNAASYRSGKSATFTAADRDDEERAKKRV